MTDHGIEVAAPKFQNDRTIPIQDLKRPTCDRKEIACALESAIANSRSLWELQIILKKQGMTGKITTRKGEQWLTITKVTERGPRNFNSNKMDLSELSRLLLSSYISLANVPTVPQKPRRGFRYNRYHAYLARGITEQIKFKSPELHYHVRSGNISEVLKTLRAIGYSERMINLFRSRKYLVNIFALVPDDYAWRQFVALLNDLFKIPERRFPGPERSGIGF